MPAIFVDDVKKFLFDYGADGLKGKISIILVLIEKVENGFQAISITGGNWVEKKSGVFDDIPPKYSSTGYKGLLEESVDPRDFLDHLHPDDKEFPPKLHPCISR